MAAAFAPHRYIIVLAVPFDDDSWPYAAYADIADFMLLMGYDQHWEKGIPGSIAGQSWFEKTLDKRMKALDPDRTIIAIGSYGYDWVKGKPAEDLTFEEAVLSARDSEADIDFDPKTENPHFSFIEDNGQRHDVWFLDGVTAFNEIHAADVYRPAGYAVWRLGSEDPSIWSVLGRPYDSPAPDGLRVIGTSQDIDFEGEGEILRVAEKPTPGARTFEIEKIQAISTTRTIRRYLRAMSSSGPAPSRNKLALTFDDGPDPRLDAEDPRHPEGQEGATRLSSSSAKMLRPIRISCNASSPKATTWATTPSLTPISAEMPDALIALELNATQRLFEALTGRSMRLFRAPYLGDAEPTTADEIVPIQIAQSMGYFSVGLHVDPERLAAASRRYQIVAARHRAGHRSEPRH